MRCMRCTAAHWIEIKLTRELNVKFPLAVVEGMMGLLSGQNVSLLSHLMSHQYLYWMQINKTI